MPFVNICFFYMLSSYIRGYLIATVNFFKILSKIFLKTNHPVVSVNSGASIRVIFTGSAYELLPKSSQPFGSIESD